MLSPILEAITVSLCLGFICIWVSRLLNRTLVSATTVFWVAWTGFLIAAWYSEWTELIPAISERATQLVELAEAGVAVGCLVGSFLAGRIAPSPQHFDAPVDRGISQRQLNLAMMVIAATGMAYLFETLSKTGWNIQTLLFDVRIQYVTEGLTPLGRFSEYFCELSLPLAIFLARRDAGSGIRIMPIVWLTLANSPNGFATGGRGYLMTPLLYYTFAYLSATRGKRKLGSVMKRFRMPARRAGFRIAIGMTAFAAVFTIIGEARWGATSDKPFYVRAVNTVMEYPASAISSVYQYSDVYSDRGGNGRFIVEWPAVQLERFGVFSTDTRKDEDAARRDVMMEYGSVNNCPPTIIPFLIGDFGQQLMPVYFAVIMAIAQFITVRPDIRGFFAHSVTAMALAGVFFTIQANMLFAPSHCLGLMWAGLMMLYTRRHPVHRGQPQAAPLRRVVRV